MSERAPLTRSPRFVAAPGLGPGASAGRGKLGSAGICGTGCPLRVRRASPPEADMIHNRPPAGWGASARVVGGPRSRGGRRIEGLGRSDPAPQGLERLFLGFQETESSGGRRTCLITTRKCSSCGLFLHCRSSSLKKKHQKALF